MRLAPKLLTAAVLIVAGLGCWAAASFSAGVIEDRSARAVEHALLATGHDWAEVATDGLLVHLGGTAPTEAERLNALHAAGTVVDVTRIVDDTTVAPGTPLTPPPYSMEILRNDDGITLIGLVPAGLDRGAMENEIRALAEGTEVTDLLQTASYAEPDDWKPALDFGLNVLARLPRSKISIAPGKVAATAIGDSPENKRALEATLTRRVPAGLLFDLDISAPRPVIAPFTLRFVIDGDGARFDACAADTERSRDRILAAGAEAGVIGAADCTIGLGVPTPEWANATIQGIRALHDLGGGTITFTDADVTLVALETAPQRDFDRVVGELESNLPKVFSLHSVRPRPQTVAVDAGPPEFTATRSPEGDVQLSGRLNNPLVRDTVGAYAQARFGVEQVHMAARIDDTLPDVWPMRVLAGLQALSELASGSVTVAQDAIEVRGVAGNKEAQAEIGRMLTARLAGAQQFRIDVSYNAALDPLADLPTAQQCVDRVNAVLADTKITFGPGSTKVEGGAARVVDSIAAILKQCRKVEMEIEIAGHTDSQGREQMNLELSQKRAEAVLEALVARRVQSSKMSARGYGESAPIADNKSEAGRETNRRIEFRLVGDAAPAEGAPAEDAGPPADDAGASDPEGTAAGDATPPDTTSPDAAPTGQAPDAANAQMEDFD